MTRLFARALLAFVVLLAACSRNGDEPGVPQNVTVTAGDGRVVVSWQPEAGIQYWIFSQVGESVSFPGSVGQPGYRSFYSIVSPYAVTGLQNGTTYAFAMAGSRDGSPAGPVTQVFTATPRAAGDAWTAGAGIGQVAVNAIAFDGVTNFVAVGAGGAIYTTTDGYLWTSARSGSVNDLTGVAYVSGRWVAVGANGTALTSTDGVTWTVGVTNTQVRFNGVGARFGRFVAAGDGGTLMMSTDGTNWSAAYSGTSRALYGVGASVDRFVAVGDGGALLTSIDGLNWFSVPSGAASSLRAVTFGMSRIVAVGDGGVIVTSDDNGATWSATNSGTGTALSGVAFGSQFSAVGKGGLVLVSADGKTWTQPYSGSFTDLHAISFGAGRFIAIGLNGTNLISL